MISRNLFVKLIEPYLRSFFRQEFCSSKVVDTSSPDKSEHIKEDSAHSERISSYELITTVGLQIFIF